MGTLSNKKTWTTPDVQVLDIKKDTFSGSGPGCNKSGRAREGSSGAEKRPE